MIGVDLRTHTGAGAGPPRKVYLRELSGHDESFDGTAAELIDRLLLERPGAAARPGEAARLTLAEVDRVLAAIYRSLYGDEVECHVNCASCGSPYTMSFTLTDMWDALTETSAEDEQLLAELEGPDERGVFGLGALRFRLPTGEDLLEAAAGGPEGVAAALRSRCVLAEDDGRGDETLDRAMSLTGPTFDTDLEGACPECGAEQSVPFRLEEFLLAALRRESAMLAREVHELARAYGWSRREILEMTRRERRQHAGLVLAEAASSGGLT